MHLKVCLILALFAASQQIPAQARVSYEDAILTGLVWRAHINLDSTFPPRLRSAIVAYNRRSAAYIPKQRVAPFPEFKMMIAPVWAEYERRLVAISGEHSAVTAARAYVDSLRPPYEWEGYHDGPEREATFADEYRAMHPESPFRELLPLIAAHRWLCTEEGYKYEGRPNEAARSRESFLRAIDTALRSADPLVGAAAHRLFEQQRCRTS